MVQEGPAEFRYLSGGALDEGGEAPGKFHDITAFLDTPSASQNVKLYRSLGRRNIENSEKIGVY